MTFDPFAPEFDVDPYPALNALREAQPVYYWETGRAWFVSRYDDCVELLRDPRLSTRAADWRYALELPPTPLDEFRETALFSLSGETHLRLRRLLGPAFSARSIAARRADIQAVVDAALDELAGRSHFDLVPDFSGPIPVRVMSQILGIPRGHDATFRAFATTVVAGMVPGRAIPAEGVRALDAGQKLLESLIEERRRTPGADVMSELIRTEEQGDRLSTSELTMLVKSLIVAGAETTTHLLGMGAVQLLCEPAELALLRAEPERIEAAVEELARFVMIGRFGSMPRYTREPLEIRGTKIDAGEMVIPLLPAALRDPRRFPDPDRFDIGRDPGHSILFGHGPHYCVGAALARLEVQVGLGTLFQRYPDLQLAGDPVFEFNPHVRSAISIPVRAIP